MNKFMGNCSVTMGRKIKYYDYFKRFMKTYYIIKALLSANSSS